jgi:glycosyltransferase involved in cell wall biosynthesis
LSEQQLEGADGVSCIVAAHESLAWVGEAVESILAQTHPPFEVIVVCSADDGTASAARRYPEPVRVLEIENVSPPHTRNVGASAARAGLLAFLDADDRWRPEKLARQLALLRDRPELGGCVTEVVNVWEDELAAEADAYEGHPRAGVIPGYATISLLVRREAWERVGPLREDLWYADSAEWFLRARGAGVEIELLPEALVEHRRTAGSLTWKGEERGRAEFLSLLRGSLAGGARDEVE